MQSFTNLSNNFIFSFLEKPESVQPAEGQVLCKVCGDIANGIHFGVNTCEGCKVHQIVVFFSIAKTVDG